MAADRAQPGADAAADLAGACSSRRPPTDRFLARLRRGDRRARRARAAAHDTWWQRRFPDAAGPIAYFSAEFALHQSLPIYAGGLGVLAGDHCKEASDLGVPLIGVGFMYPQGYFHQNVSPEGWQEEAYERLNWADAPIEPAIDAGRQALHHRRAARQPHACSSSVWRVRLGRVKLYLLDTDLEENAPWDRELSARLYGGDRETRIQQEIILGIGGVRALKALGIDAGGLAPQRRPRRRSSCCSASAISIERGAVVRRRRSRKCAGRRSSRRTRRCRPATTRFPFNLVETHLAGCWGTLGAYRDALPGARRTTTTAAARSST